MSSLFHPPYIQINSASPGRSTIPKKPSSGASTPKNSVIHASIPRRSGTFSPGDNRVQTSSDKTPSRTTNGQDIRQYVGIIPMYTYKHTHPPHNSMVVQVVDYVSSL